MKKKRKKKRKKLSKRLVSNYIDYPIIKVFCTHKLTETPKGKGDSPAKTIFGWCIDGKAWLREGLTDGCQLSHHM